MCTIKICFWRHPILWWRQRQLNKRTLASAQKEYGSFNQNKPKPVNPLQYGQPVRVIRGKTRIVPRETGDDSGDFVASAIYGAALSNAQTEPTDRWTGNGGEFGGAGASESWDTPSSSTDSSSSSTD